MREFNADLLNILKTEGPKERSLRENEAERQQYMARMIEGSGDPRVYESGLEKVFVTRKPRYVACPPHQTGMLEMIYMVNGTLRFSLDGRELVMNAGDFLLPNLHTHISWDAPGQDDIMVSFNMKPQFLEDLCIELRSNTVLSDFLLDALRGNSGQSRYLHFSAVNDLAVYNLAETLIYAAFPCLTEDNMGCGSPPDGRITGFMMCALFISLSRNLDSLTPSSTTTYAEALRKAVQTYISREYRSATLQELARNVCQSESVLSRQIRDVFGQNFTELLLQHRFDRARNLLQSTSLPIADIAQAVGYENMSFFYRRFREIHGVSPKEYRKTFQSQHNGKKTDTN